MQKHYSGYTIEVLNCLNDMKQEIQPCPFCWSESHLLEFHVPHNSDIFYTVHCSNGDCVLSDGVLKDIHSSDDAIKLWNNRG